MESALSVVGPIQSGTRQTHLAEQVISGLNARRPHPPVKAILSLLAVSCFVSLPGLAHEKGAPLTAADKAYLAQYEAVRAALAADKLSDAKKAATEIVQTPVATPKDDADAKRAATNLEAAKNLAVASSLADARDAFKTLSRKAAHLNAVHVAVGGSGYYVYVCPHIPDEAGKWVQTSKEVSNPYHGPAMSTCGVLKE